MARGISPNTNNGADLGSENKHWRKIYANSANDELNLGNNYSLNYRRPNHAYTVGNKCKSNKLAYNRKLICVKAGTTADGELTITSSYDGTLIYDGTVVWQVDSILRDYNSISDFWMKNLTYRGADITAFFDSGIMSERISSGHFQGIYAGDFIKKSITLPAVTYTDKEGESVTLEEETIANIAWRIASFENYFYIGEPMVLTNHVVVIPDGAIRTASGFKMNPTADTTGGYLGSDLWRIHMPRFATAIKNAFGENHVLAYSDRLTNVVNEGVASGNAWTTVEVNIPTESMVAGKFYSSSPLDSGVTISRSILFDTDRMRMGGRSSYWLRDVASASEFSSVSFDGPMAKTRANVEQYIRPFFLLY